MEGVAIHKVRGMIHAACAGANRDPGSILVVGVTKGRTVEQVKQALTSGITDIGENRVQEALLKYNALQAFEPKARWHMIGHLQTNKVKDAVRIFDLIHSVDSLRLAKEIDAQAASFNKVQDVLLEVKVSPEATKDGVAPDQAAAAIEELAALPHIKVRGLMTIAPPVAQAQHARPYFRQLRELLAEINAKRTAQDGMGILSMGMSDDFQAAVAEGATIVRLGRVLFGPN